MKKYTFGLATKKLIALTLCCVTAVPTLTSCGVDPAYNTERIQSSMDDRFYDTKMLAESMHDSGLISNTSYEQIISNTDTLNGLLLSSFNGISTTGSGFFEKSKVQDAWIKIAHCDIFDTYNFYKGYYHSDTLNLLQGIIAFKPINHSKHSGDTINDAIGLDQSCDVDTDKGYFGQPWIDQYEDDGNDLYGNDDWGGSEEGWYRPETVDDVDNAEILYSVTNLMCIHKMLFNVREAFGNTHLDRWFVKGAYVDSSRNVIALDTKYNTWAYYNDWMVNERGAYISTDSNKSRAEDIADDVNSGGNKGSSWLNNSRQSLVDDLNESLELDDLAGEASINWVSEDKYFYGLNKAGGYYSLSTYGKDPDGNDYNHKVYSIPGANFSTTHIPIDTKYPYTAMNSTCAKGYQAGTIYPSDDWDDYKDDCWTHNQDVCFPVNVVPPSVINEFNEALDLPVYTLKTDAITSGGYTAITSMIGNSSKTKDMLNKYFTPAYGGKMTGSNTITQSSSGALTLRDILYAECEKLSSGNDEYLNYLLDTKNLILTSTWNDNPVEEITYTIYDDDYDTVKTSSSGYGVKNEPGKDLVYCQKVGDNGEVTPILAIRINEFNLPYCSMLNSVLGLFNDTSMKNSKAVADANYGRYKLVTDADGKAIGVVLLEYPVDAITRFKGNDNGRIYAEFADSGLGINVASGKVIKYNYTGGKGSYTFDKSGNYIDDKDSIYYNTVNGDKQIALGSTIKVLGSRVTSLGLVGNTLTYQYGHYSSNKSSSTTISQDYGVYTPRFYLTVYLEALYAPGLCSDSNVALFGRRMYMRDTTTHGVREDKVTNRSVTLADGTTVDASEKTLSYTAEAIFADYIDLDGNKLKYNGDDLEVKISDICNFYGLIAENAHVDYFGTEAGTVEDIGSDSKEHTVTELKHTSLAIRNTNSIRAGIMFASDDIGTVDAEAEKNYTSDEKASTENVLLRLNILNPSSDVSKALLGTMDSSMTEYVNNNVYGSSDEISMTAGDIKKRNRFWCITTKKSLFSDEVYNGWMTGDANDLWGKSLAWWNQYLESNSFAYRITAQTFNTYAKQNYKNQMISRGEVNDYDLDAIGDISDYYKAEAKKERVQNIRTVFKIVGYIIIAFAFILILLWAIDTNTDLGMNLLQKVTFGNWVAIKYAADIPDNRNMDKKYITGGKIIVKSMILIAVGLVIIVVNAFDIVSFLVDTFGTIGRTIEDFIKGK